MITLVGKTIGLSPWHYQNLVFHDAMIYFTNEEHFDMEHIQEFLNTQTYSKESDRELFERLLRLTVEELIKKKEKGSWSDSPLLVDMVMTDVQKEFSIWDSSSAITEEDVAFYNKVIQGTDTDNPEIRKQMIIDILNSKGINAGMYEVETILSVIPCAQMDEETLRHSIEVATKFL